MRSFSWILATFLSVTVLVGSITGQDLAGPAAARVAELNEQIDTLNEGENWEEAHAVQLKVLEIYLRELGDGNVNTASELEYTADQLSSIGRYQEAKSYFMQARNAYKRTVGEESEDFLRAHFSYGQALRMLSEFEQSRIVQKINLANATRIYGARSLDVALVLEEMGAIEMDSDNYESARSHFLDALQIYPSLDADDQNEQIWPLTRLINIEIVLGDFVSAEKYLVKANEVAIRGFGNESYEMTEVLLGLGYLAQTKGDFGTARKHYERVLAIGAQLNTRERETTQHATGYLASIFIELGDYVAAERLLEELYSIEVRQFGKDMPAPYHTLSDLGYLDYMQEKNADAREKYGQSLAGFKRILGATHSTTLAMEHGIAEIDHQLLKYDESRERLNKLLEIYTKKFENDEAELGYLYWSMAWLEHDAGDYVKSREFYNQAIKIFSDRIGPDHPDKLTLDMMLTFLSATERKWKEAFERADANARAWKKFNSRILASLSPTEQILFLKDDEEKSMYLAMAQANQDDPEAVATTAGWLLNSKGVAQESLAAREMLTRDLDDEESRQIAKQLLKVREELASLAISKPEEEKAEERTARIAELTKQEELLGRQLGDRIGNPLMQSEWIELDAVRAALSADQTMINVIQSRAFDLFAVKSARNRFSAERYFAYIIPPLGKGQVKLVDLGESAAIDEAVTKIRSWIGDSKTREAGLAESRDATAATDGKPLFADAKEKIWDPIAKHLPEDTKQLVLSPDGALWLMPWNTIPTGEDRFLIEDYSIRFLTSGRELALPKVKAANGVPLLFADPTFDLTPDSVRSAVQAIFRSANVQKLPAGEISRTAIPQALPLPSTRLEALAISPSVLQVCGKEPIQYLGKFALETVAKKVKSPRILVLSTHGFFLPEQQKQSGSRTGGANISMSHKLKGAKPENPLLRCGLLLAGCNNPTARGDDGILTGMEILGLDLRGTELVVLSACETGVGRVNSGEGVAGLRQAFQLAGAEAIVSTLWQVPDRDSALLMRDFFQILADGKSHPEALRQAQIQRIESRRKRYGAAHPFYWAAWTLTGN